MTSQYVVNVGNVGNIECKDEADAFETYKHYVLMSITGCGRGAHENVVLFVDGEPDSTKDFNWYGHRVEMQKAMVHDAEVKVRLARQVLQKEVECLSRLILKQGEVEGI